ncbi:MAG: enoyl-CoA hydratase/isomerase family protein [Tepidiformaceae bacterium]
MTIKDRYGDLSVQSPVPHVTVVEIQRPPNNFFDTALIASLADVYEALDEEPSCRVIVLAAEGKHFCAGASFGSPRTDQGARGDLESRGDDGLYAEAARLISAKKPVIAAVQGAAIGGGLGLACSADFRVGCPETRMAANFARLGFHHGFGLTVLLPPIVGQQRSLELLLTGRRIAGTAAHAMGLLDRLVPLEDVRAEAVLFAEEIAASAPLAVTSIRATMREGLVARFRNATDHESKEQAVQNATEDFREGVRAMDERRAPIFSGR